VKRDRSWVFKPRGYDYRIDPLRLASFAAPLAIEGSSKLKSRRLQLLHEIVDAVAWHAGREEILYWHLQHFG
jgi:hypothetical protein